jgi:hypothetical protein
MTSSGNDAARLDKAIDSLLADEGSLGMFDAEPELTTTARLLRDVLPRFHPRFGFEEVVAGRIAAMSRAGSAMRDSVSTTIPATMPEPISLPTSEHSEPQGRHLRWLAGGAIASGVSIAIPLTGAALVMWRRGRSRGGLF